MVRWVVGSILHGVDPLSYFSFHPVLHDWCNKGRGMCYPVCLHQSVLFLVSIPSSPLPDGCNKGHGMCYPVCLHWSVLFLLNILGARCSSGKSVRSWCDGLSDPSFMGWTHWAISRSIQCSTTGVTKAVVCAILSVCIGQCFSFSIFWERDVTLWYERSLMVRWVVGSILHGVDPLSYFSFQPVLHDWCNKGVVCAILSVGWYM